MIYFRLMTKLNKKNLAENANGTTSWKFRNYYASIQFLEKKCERFRMKMFFQYIHQKTPL